MLIRSTLLAALGLLALACDDASSTVPGDTSEVLADTVQPETDAVQAEATDTRAETADATETEADSAPLETDTAQPEVADTTAPETADTTAPETADTTGPETTDITDSDGETIVPSGWTCAWNFYGDADCDCGCGIIDIDCPANATETDCEYCIACGTEMECIGALVEGDITTCITPDCGDNVATPTEECDGTDLRGETCASLPAFYAGVLGCTSECVFDTTDCDIGVAPPLWICAATWYGDGECDCGCGAVDSDCPFAATAADCRVCNCDASGDCGRLEPHNISQCIATECGDGVVEGFEECDGIELDGGTCVSEGYPSGTLACSGTCAYDVGGCARPPVPDGWVGEVEWYGDGECDCGCGALDIDCPAAATAADCQACIQCGFGIDDCTLVVYPTDITQCIE